MKTPEKALLLALAKGKLGDYEADLGTLKSQRDSLASVLGVEHPLQEKRKKTLRLISNEIVDVEKKIRILSRLIDAAERGG